MLHLSPPHEDVSVHPSNAGLGVCRSTRYTCLHDSQALPGPWTQVDKPRAHRAAHMAEGEYEETV